MFGSVSSVVGRTLATATRNQLHPNALLRRRFVALPRIPEGLSSLKSPIGIGSSSNGIRRVVPVLGAFAVATAIGQYYYGNEPNFYDYRFICDADPNDLADFYGSENFMDIYCVLPFMGTLMMRGGYFDEDGTVHTTGLPGEMLVSMVFSDSDQCEEEEDDDHDDDGPSSNDQKGVDGPPELTRNGQWFNKRERFKDVFRGRTMWDMVTNFGFVTLPDGRCLVYHHGEYFKGNFPPISLFVRLVFGMHAQWVAWATEHHINHYAFKNSTEFDEKMEHDSRVDMPLFLVKNYAWSDLMAALFGRKVEKPSFLVKKSAEEAAKMKTVEETEEIEEDAEAKKERLEADAKVLSEKHELPFQNPAIMRRITMDIDMDRHNSNLTLTGADDLYEDLQESAGKDKKEEVLARRQSSKKTGTTLKRISTNVALKRYETSLHRTLTRMKSGPGGGEGQGLHRRDSLGRDHLGGNAAWEALRSTNNPEAYKAASYAAHSKFAQRRVTLRRQNSVDSGLSEAISDSSKGQE